MIKLLDKKGFWWYILNVNISTYRLRVLKMLGGENEARRIKRKKKAYT